MSDAVRQLMQSKVELGRGFDWRFSVPFPALWPIVPGCTLVTYGAGLRPSSSSPTLFEHSALLCRVVHDPMSGLTATFERLSPSVEAAGVTATRPISGTELEQVRTLPKSAELFFQLAIGAPRPEIESAIRTQFDFFRKTHGWMFALISPLHSAFVTWLDAPR